MKNIKYCVYFDNEIIKLWVETPKRFKIIITAYYTAENLQKIIDIKNKFEKKGVFDYVNI